MAKEHAQLVGLLSAPAIEHEGNYEFTIGTLGKNTLILMSCGMGKVNAAVGAATLIRRYTPDCIISTGCAGGIDERLKVMDVVVSSETSYHDVLIPGYEVGQMQGLPARFRAEQELVETALKVHPSREGNGGTEASRVFAGLICTGDQFITDRTQLERIKSQFPEGLAVDMESAAIAQTCFLLQTPFVSFRVISDTPGADKQMEKYFNFWDQMADHSFDVTRRFLANLPEQFSLLPFE